MSWARTYALIVQVLQSSFGLTPGTGGGGGTYTLTGPIKIGDGTAVAPSYSYTNDPTTGFYSLTSGYGAYSAGGNPEIEYGPGLLQVASGTAFSWSSTTSAIGGTDTAIVRDAANTVAQRRGANSQTFRVYNTYTDASNYERATMTWNGNVLNVGVEVAGSGTNRTTQILGSAVNIVTAAGTAWQFRSDGPLLALSNYGIWLGASALATNATAGFLGINSCAGTPTGTPASIPTAQVPLVYDSTNHILYAYDGGSWKKPMASLVTGNVTWQ